MSLADWDIYGHEEGDSSLDTTLKSVYNVPGTQQLEVYYDAKDYTQASDFAGSGGVVDKAGGDQDGTAGSGVSFDSTYKAFTFDGTTDGVISDELPSTVTGAYVHSVSLWFKHSGTGNTLYTLVHIGDATSGQSVMSDLLVYDTGKLRFGFYDNDSDTPDGIITLNQWYHVVATYSGGTGNAHSRKIYVNGKEIPLTLSGAYNANSLSLPSDPMLYLGSQQGSIRLTGSIANFRLFSKALNADQIKELYDYQKDYFLGSKSQVTLYKGHLGIGVAEPSGQLELAGDERIQEYPPGPMDGRYSMVAGHGEFQAYASTELGTLSVDKIFNKIVVLNADDRWRSSSSVYTATAGGSPALTTSGSAKLASNTPYGQWVVLKLPYKTCLKQYSWVGLTTQDPKEGQIWGSNDGHSWSHVNSFTNGGDAWVAAGSSTSSYTVYENRRTVTGNTTYYSYYAMIITMLVGSDDAAGIRELKFFGTPGPTTLDKGSLTLGRSLDVPRISRYDVDTETPRPEKLVVDFDTTVNSSPTDISGQGNHGTLVGATYSAPDKAFSFDGSNDTIYNSGIGNWTNNISHTFSWWFKCDSVGPSNYGGGLVNLYNTASTENHYSSFSFNTGSTGKISFYHYSNDVIYNYPFELNRWYHVAGVYSGSSTTGQKVYVDGVDLGPGTHSGVTTALLLGTNPKLSIGGDYGRSNYYFDGQISNFKLYNVALEASEVKKLYNLGRTGRSMVISDTAVGIGKVPEAQLDVRGSGGFTGDLTVGGNMNNYQYWFRGERRNQSVTTGGIVNGSSSNRILVEYNTIDGYTSAWKSNQYYEVPVDGVYMTMGSFMAYPTHEAISYAWALVVRLNSAGSEIDDGEVNDMHDPRNHPGGTTIFYQSWQFKQSHKCNKGDRLQVNYVASTDSSAMQLHGGWGNITIFKLG
jgi:hypothetical protein